VSAKDLGSAPSPLPSSDADPSRTTAAKLATHGHPTINGAYYSSQLSLLDFEPRGETYDAAQDRDRLLTLQQRVEAKADGQPRTLLEWCAVIGAGSPTGVSARLRQARSRGFEVIAQRIAGGTWSYALRRVTG
jgi:hypothetical protein